MYENLAPRSVDPPHIRAQAGKAKPNEAVKTKRARDIPERPKAGSPVNRDHLRESWEQFGDQNGLYSKKDHTVHAEAQEEKIGFKVVSSTSNEPKESTTTDSSETPENDLEQRIRAMTNAKVSNWAASVEHDDFEANATTTEQHKAMDLRVNDEEMQAQEERDTKGFSSTSQNSRRPRDRRPAKNGFRASRDPEWNRDLVPGKLPKPEIRVNRNKRLVNDMSVGKTLAEGQGAYLPGGIYNVKYQGTTRTFSCEDIEYYDDADYAMYGIPRHLRPNWKQDCPSIKPSWLKDSPASSGFYPDGIPTKDSDTYTMARDGTLQPRIRPKVNMSLRSAREEDMAQVKSLYNDYVVSGVHAIDSSPTSEEDWIQRWQEARADRKPFLVATLSDTLDQKFRKFLKKGEKERKARGDPLEKDRVYAAGRHGRANLNLDPADKIIGFAVSERFGQRHSIFDKTAEVFVYTHKDYQRHGVATMLIDQILSAHDTYYVSQRTQEVQTFMGPEDTAVNLGRGGVGMKKTVITAFYVRGDKEEEAMFRGKKGLLEEVFGFYQSSMMMNIGEKTIDGKIVPYVSLGVHFATAADLNQYMHGAVHARVGDLQGRLR